MAASPTPARPATSTPAPPAAAAAAAQPEVVKTDDAVDPNAGSYVVAPGRTVSTIEDAADKHYGPGEKVKLSAGEATRLLKAGFILDKDGAAVIRADGPAVNVEDGVAVAPQG